MRKVQAIFFKLGVVVHHLIRSWRFDSLTRNELNALASTATLVLPLGSTEQHAHHLPVSVDAAVVTYLAQEAVALASFEIPVLLLPTLAFGFAQHHLPFGGTVSLRAETYVNVLIDIVTGLAEQGFRRIIFLNGHGGNESPMHLVVDKISSQAKLDLHLAATSYWNVAQESLTNLGFPSSTVPGHAGHFETSLMLALAPESVHLERRPNDVDAVQPLAEKEIPKAHIRRPTLWENSDGRTDDGQLASAEIGAKVLSDISKEIASFFIKFHRSSR
jgi:creatinine amidohydrolase